MQAREGVAGGHEHPLRAAPVFLGAGAWGMKERSIGGIRTARLGATPLRSHFLHFVGESGLDLALDDLGERHVSVAHAWTTIDQWRAT